MAPEYVSSSRTEQNTSGIIICSIHFEQFLVIKTKYLRVADDSFWFEELDRLLLLLYKTLFEKNGPKLLV